MIIERQIPRTQTTWKFLSNQNQSQPYEACGCLEGVFARKITRYGGCGQRDMWMPDQLTREIGKKVIGKKVMLERSDYASCKALLS